MDSSSKRSKAPNTKESTVMNTTDETVISNLTLWDYFAANALANPSICTGSATNREYDKWFDDRVGITRSEIVAAQAAEFADVMLVARSSRGF